MTLTSRLLVRGLRRRDLYVLDALLAAALSFACGLAAGETPQSGGWHEPLGVTLLTAVLIGGPAAARRLLPVPMVAVSLTVSAVALATGVIADYASGSVVAVLACELYIVGSEIATRSVPTLAVTLAALAVAVTVSPGNQGSPIGAAFACLVVAGAWLLGRIRREQRLHAAQVAEQRTQNAVGDERLRIARELHDIVAHSMSLIAVRAGVARHVFEARPQEARAALRDIEATSRSALGQLRQVVEVLREEDGLYAPAPGLDDLRALADRAATGGVSVHLTITAAPETLGPETVGREVVGQEAAGREVVGPEAARREVVGPETARREMVGPETVGPEAAGQEAAGQEAAGQEAAGPLLLGQAAGGDVVPRVPEAVGLSAYRIVQEALTNVVKHAAPANCTATVTVTPAEVRIRVVNDGVGAGMGRSAGGGHGIIGMRERVVAWGGEFSAGPGGRDGGFVVTATLPYRGAGS